MLTVVTVIVTIHWNRGQFVALNILKIIAEYLTHAWVWSLDHLMFEVKSNLHSNAYDNIDKGIVLAEHSSMLLWAAFFRFVFALVVSEIDELHVSTLSCQF